MENLINKKNPRGYYVKILFSLEWDGSGAAAGQYLEFEWFKAESADDGEIARNIYITWLRDDVKN